MTESEGAQLEADELALAAAKDDLTEARMVRIPNCDFPHEVPTPALYDAKTIHGPWAYMCQTHFDSDHRGGLGLGIGQKLVLA